MHIYPVTSLGPIHFSLNILYYIYNRVRASPDVRGDNTTCVVLGLGFEIEKSEDFLSRHLSKPPKAKSFSCMYSAIP